MKKIHYALTIGLILATNSFAIRDISSRELVKDIRLGWNLGNTLDAECTSWLDYYNDQIASETCWGNVKTSEYLFITLINKGFNLFRIPVTWKGHYGPAPDYKIDERWLARVREIVDYSYQNGAYVIINTHHEDWINAYSQNIDNAKEIAIKLWEQIAEEFKEYDEHLIFESMNNPRKFGSNEEHESGDDDSWVFINEINKVFIKTIRNGKGNNPIRHLLIPPYANVIHDDTIEKLFIPDNDNKIMVSLHAYIPYTFTNGSSKTFTETSNIDWTMNTINNKLLSKNVATIITEFGSVFNNNEGERIKWADYFISKASEIGVPCTLWDNGKFNSGKDNYGIINRSSFEIKYPDYLDVLLEGSYASIDDTNLEKERKTQPSQQQGQYVDEKEKQIKYINNVKRENFNNNVKIEPLDDTSDIKPEKIIFSTINKIKQLNDNVKCDKRTVKREESNNIKIEPLDDTYDIEPEKTVFSTINKIKQLNNTVNNDTSTLKREEPNSNIKIEPLDDTSDIKPEKIIFSTINKKIQLNNTIENEIPIVKREEKPNSNIKIEPLDDTSNIKPEKVIFSTVNRIKSGKIIFSTINRIKQLNNTVKSDKQTVKKEESNNIKIEPLDDTYDIEPEKTVFSTINKIKQLNNTVNNDTSTLKREEPNSNIKIEPLDDTSDIKPEKIIFSTINKKIQLNNTIEDEIPIVKREEKPNNNVKIEAYNGTKTGNVIFSTVYKMIPLNNTKKDEVKLK